MSPASRSKSKDKAAARTAAKEQKASSKPAPLPANGGSSIPASAYNPVSGTFHTLETSPTASPPPQSNGRFRNIDETDEHSGTSSLGNAPEYDSVSNNDSCSGESEDQKEKTGSNAHRLETIPGADNDKREKIRQKNERKHQRQRERRAQELHERCSGYLMSRKLEALAQQLVAMGFSSERATMALILNEGRVEESVAWLFEGGEEVAAAQQKGSTLDSGGNLKIDITEELARTADMEVKFKCTKQEVERVVVTCEGDLDKAVETLRAQKQEPVAAPPKPEETGDPPAVSNSKLTSSPAQIAPRTLQVKAVAASPVTIQQRRDERDFNYTKVAVGPAVASPETVNRNLQSLRRSQQKAATEWARPQQVLNPQEKRWPSMNSSSPSVSYSLASTLQVAPLPAKTEPPRYVVVGSTEGKPMQNGGTVREPVIMMQRPQSVNVAKQNHPTTSLGASPPITPGWYQNGVNGVDLMKVNGGLGHIQTTSMSTSNPVSQPYYHPQAQYQPFATSSVESAGWGSSWNPATGSSSSASIAVPSSSLGLFTGWGSAGTSGSSSPVDWSMGGSMPECDYTNIDWSLEATSASSRSNGLWMGLTSYVKNGRMCEGGWSGTSMMGGANMMRSSGIQGLHEGGVAADAGPSSSAGSHDWTSPFAGKDLFSIPRQYVTSPSL
ncbi:hypothetical protein H6P81_007699 [Aristolochia fimbriata]|uniref:UBA domain-containing protein n=1 Tax=Aristolochia fimbriata TaxID=158543 RepID=A0AAV7F394_ARIFI|nr:hypothetical protein H6P81_007699 [Aristolochia fimbriata]